MISNLLCSHQTKVILQYKFLISVHLVVFAMYLIINAVKVALQFVSVFTFSSFFMELL